MAKKKTKSKKPAVEMTLWGVVLSYPDLDKPKPYKGKIYYKTDCLLDEDHAQLKELRSAIGKVKRLSWGEDKSEWPTDLKVLLQNGDSREDQKAYQGKFYISASTQQPVPVVDPKGREFNAASVRGGMTANVAIRISKWENEGDEGISIYLQGVQIDTKVERLAGFGGGKSVKQMFGLDESSDDEDDDSDSDDQDDEDDTPRGKKKAKKSDDGDEDDSDSSENSDSDDEDEDLDDEDESPRKKSSKKKNFDEDDDDEE